MGGRYKPALTSSRQQRIVALLHDAVSSGREPDARSIAEQVGTGDDYVREVAKAAGYCFGTKQAEQRAARREHACRLLKEGMTVVEVASKAGISRSRAFELRKQMSPQAIEIPAWVPEEYRRDYALIVETDDEFAAAAYVRRQKQMRAA